MNNTPETQFYRFMFGQANGLHGDRSKLKNALSTDSTPNFWDHVGVHEALSRMTQIDMCEVLMKRATRLGESDARAAEILSQLHTGQDVLLSPVCMLSFTGNLSKDGVKPNREIGGDWAQRAVEIRTVEKLKQEAEDKRILAGGLSELICD